MKKYLLKNPSLCINRSHVESRIALSVVRMYGGVMLHIGTRALIGFILIVLSGCSSLSTEREVLQDNTFTSSRYPEINIKIDDGFTYVGKATATKYNKHKTHPGGSNVFFESHIFCEFDSRRKIKSAVVIRLLKINSGIWLPDNFSNVKYQLESGITNVGGLNYQYVTFPDTSPFIDYEELYLFDSGYQIPNCFLVKAIARREGAKNKNKYYVAYLEATDTILDGKYRCKTWVDANILEHEQKDYLYSF